MIVHIAEMGQLADVASEIPAVAVPLIQAYWPGPITFIMKSRGRADGDYRRIGYRGNSHAPQ